MMTDAPTKTPSTQVVQRSSKPDQPQPYAVSRISLGLFVLDFVVLFIMLQATTDAGVVDVKSLVEFTALFTIGPSLFGSIFALAGLMTGDRSRLVKWMLVAHTSVFLIGQLVSRLVR